MTDSGSVVEPITALGDVEQIVRDTQWQFWRIVPPSIDDPFYLHPEPLVRAVDWQSKAWPKPFLKQMVAELGSAGVSKSIYPFYRLTVIEERCVDIVYYNAENREVWRTAAPKDYNPYQFAFLQFGVRTADALSTQQKLFGRSSNVGMDLILIPSVFTSAYEADTVFDTASIPLATVPNEMEASSSLSLMTTLSVPAPPGTNTTTGGSAGSSNVTATLMFNVPDGFGRYAEIFQSDTLRNPSWSVAVNSTNITGIPEFAWTDPSSINVQTRFYILSDADIFGGADSDGDGYSDGREYCVEDSNPNSFDYRDSDSDGLHDWFEVMWFGGLDLQSGTDDDDGDGLLAAMEVELTSSNIIFHSDPLLFDTDGGGIDDGFETTHTNLYLDPLDPADDTADFDLDELTNYDEYMLGTDLNNADTDGDGVTDGVEVEWGTYQDTNGVPVSPTVTNFWDWSDDLDGDGLTLAQEYELGTDPSDSSDSAQTNDVTTVTITIGNPTDDEGYLYQLNLTGPNTIPPVCSDDAKALSTAAVKLKKGKSYAYTLTREEPQGSSNSCPSKAYTVNISGTDLVIKDSNGVLGNHPDDDSMDAVFDGGGATGVVHVVSVTVLDEFTGINATESIPTVLGTNDNGDVFFKVGGHASMQCSIVVAPLAVRNNVDLRFVQHGKATLRRGYRYTPGHGKQLIIENSWCFDAEMLKSLQQWDNPSDSGLFSLESCSDNPHLIPNAVVYSSADIDFRFEDFIQYKVNEDDWTTLLKGTWFAKGSGTVARDEQGEFSVGSEKVLSKEVAPFGLSSEQPVEPPPFMNVIINDASNWEDY